MTNVSLYTGVPLRTPVGQLERRGIFIAKHGPKSLLNRCAAFGLNALVGGNWLRSAEDYLEVIALRSKTNIDKLRRAYQLQRALPLPVGTQFCIQNRHNRLWNITLVPQISYGAYECREFVESPLLLEVALALSTNTTRVAAMGRKALTSGAGDANHVSVYLWRPRVSDEGWVLVKPPGTAKDVVRFHLQEIGLRSTTSMKFYSMGGYGPLIKNMRDAAYTNVAKDLNKANDSQIHTFLRLKHNVRCAKLFEDFLDASPFRGDESRINYYLNIVKDIEANFDKLQP